MPRQAVTRTFLPGSEWLSAKLYLSERATDRLLGEEIAPFIASHRGAGSVDRWFLVRYGDPDHHVRLRFHGDPTALASSMLPDLMALAARLHTQDRVTELQLATYHRELDRYGGPMAIDLVERIFSADSDAVLEILADRGARAPDDRWRLTLLGLHRLLVDLGFDLEQRFEIARRSNAAFRQEFRSDADLRRDLGDHYRRERNAIEALLTERATERSHAIVVAANAFDARSATVRPLAGSLRGLARAGQLDRGLDAVATSLLHLHANRMLAARPRAQELVLYDHLERHYRSQRARAVGGP
jgi:thiopeptide-type bacteriocin biosynthesis protein